MVGSNILSYKDISRCREITLTNVLVNLASQLSTVYLSGDSLLLSVLKELSFFFGKAFAPQRQQLSMIKTTEEKWAALLHLCFVSHHAIVSF